VTGALLSVSSTATAAIVAVGASLGVVLLAAFGWWFSRRSAPATEDRMASIVRDLDARMEQMSRELTEALDRARDEQRRGRLAGELSGSLDLDDVMRRTLDAAAAVPGADGALILVEADEGEPATSAVGLTREEIEEHSLGRPPQGWRVRSLIVEYEPGPARPGAPAPISIGLAVPLHAALERIGLLSIFSRGEPDSFSESQLRELEDVAARAAPALQNARRFREARQLADLDGLTGLHNRRYFNETLARECARAQRYGRRLSLLMLDLDNLKQINETLTHVGGDAALTEVARRIRSVVRSADIPCRTGGDEYAIILPESGREDAHQLYHRLHAEISAHPIGNGVQPLVSGGVAELQAQEDAGSLYRRADEALFRAKRDGKGRVSD
jgi:diguanylate cyclase (GGDEF)-like protein